MAEQEVTACINEAEGVDSFRELKLSDQLLLHRPNFHQARYVSCRDSALLGASGDRRELIFMLVSHTHIVANEGYALSLDLAFAYFLHLQVVQVVCEGCDSPLDRLLFQLADVTHFEELEIAR